MQDRMYLVTGGAGFIGSNIVHTLVARGERVRVLDNLATGRLENLNGVRDSVEYVNGDIRDLEICRQALRGVRFVLHQAALPSVPRSVKDPVGSTAVNIQGTVNLLVAASEALPTVQQFVFASSSSVYGDTPTLPKSESMVPMPQSPYAVTKLTGEHFCRVFTRTYRLPTCCLRYFNIYGPRQDPQSTYAAVIPRFIAACVGGTRATIYGDGSQSRDFTFVEDCVEANLLACEASSTAGEVCNIGAGSRTTIAELYRMIEMLVGRSQPVITAATREGDVRHSLADITQARSLLGYAPRHDLKSGLARTVEWFTKRAAPRIEG
jgi:nucleoside-diphosphate-sugar epimerase